MATKRKAPTPTGTGAGATSRTQANDTTPARKKQPSREELGLLDEVMQTLGQTYQCEKIDNENPEINYWCDLHHKQLDAIRGITKSQRDDLEQSFQLFGTAVATAYTLYGMQVINVISTISPRQLSGYIVNRLNPDSEYGEV